MKTHYSNIDKAKSEGRKLLAVLIDPDKIEKDQLSSFIKKVNESMITHIFVGGSVVAKNLTEVIVTEIKRWTDLPVVLFPGDPSQITEAADALLFLSLISGRNPDYLIGKHVEASEALMYSNLEIIPTGYLLIENGKETSVQQVSRTSPMPRQNLKSIMQTAKAGELLGLKLMYLEAGSGATHPITPEIISAVKSVVEIPIIVGGGIRSIEQLQEAYTSGADLVVIGTAIEENASFLTQLALNISIWTKS